MAYTVCDQMLDHPCFSLAWSQHSSGPLGLGRLASAHSSACDTGLPQILCPFSHGGLLHCVRVVLSICCLSGVLSSLAEGSTGCSREGSYKWLRSHGLKTAPIRSISQTCFLCYPYACLFPCPFATVLELAYYWKFRLSSSTGDVDQPLSAGSLLKFRINKHWADAKSRSQELHVSIVGSGTKYLNHPAASQARHEQETGSEAKGDVLNPTLCQRMWPSQVASLLLSLSLNSLKTQPENPGLTPSRGAKMHETSVPPEGVRQLFEGLQCI